jgi:hypothetical protein
MRPHYDAKQMETAESINYHNPLWWVIWGVSTRHYWAFPKFNVPQGTILDERDPRELLSQMRQIELRYLPPPYHPPRQT